MLGFGAFGSNPYGSFSAGTIYKSLLDSSLASDLVSLKCNLDLIDSGALTDIIKFILGEISVLDNSSGEEFISLVNYLSLVDTGSLVDVLSIIVNVYSTDASLGHDIVSILAKLFQVDTITEDSQLDIKRSILVQDTGYLSELIDILVVKLILISDTGTLVDLVNVICHILTSDNSLGIEEIGLLNKLTVSDRNTLVTEIINLFGAISKKLQAKELIISKGRLYEVNGSEYKLDNLILNSKNSAIEKIDLKSKRF